MKYKEAVLIGGPWDGRRNWIMAGVPEVRIPTYDPSAHLMLRPLMPGEQVVYKPHTYRLVPALSNAQYSVYLHSDTAEPDAVQVLVQGYRKDRNPSPIRLTDVYEVVQSPSGPQSA